MNKEDLKKQINTALSVYEEESGNLFLYSLLNFDFNYDTEEETVEINVPFTKLMANPLGFLHGGIITYIADTAMGHLCAVFANKPGVSLELKTQFLRTVKAGNIVAKAYFVKKGKQVQFIECVLIDDRDNLIAKVTATFYSVN